MRRNKSEVLQKLCKATIAAKLSIVAILLQSTLGIAAEQVENRTPRISLDNLRNADYGEFTLQDGEYNRELEHIELLEEPMAFGDLDGDGDDDAVVVLREDAGGTGFWRHLAVMRNDNGIPVHITELMFGDREYVEALSISGNQIQVRALTHLPEDPRCCPSQLSLITLALRDKRLDVVDIVNSPISD